MAKKRKATPKRKAKAARKTATTRSARSATVASSKSGMLGSEDTLNAIMIAVGIIIVLAAIYLYQQNSKPKTSQLPPAIALIAPA